MELLPAAISIYCCPLVWLEFATNIIQYSTKKDVRKMEKILRCLQVEGIILIIVRFVHDYFSWLIKGFPLAQLAPCEWKAGRKGHYYNSLMLPVSRIVTCMLLFVCNTIRMIRNLWPSSSHMFMREWCHTCQQENLQDNCWENFFFFLKKAPI